MQHPGGMASTKIDSFTLSQQNEFNHAKSPLGGITPAQIDQVNEDEYGEEYGYEEYEVPYEDEQGEERQNDEDIVDQFAKELEE